MRILNMIKSKKRKLYRRPKPKRLEERMEARLTANVRKKLEKLLMETGDSGSSYIRRLIIKDLKEQNRW